MKKYSGEKRQREGAAAATAGDKDVEKTTATKKEKIKEVFPSVRLGCIFRIDAMEQSWLLLLLLPTNTLLQYMMNERVFVYATYLLIPVCVFYCRLKAIAVVNC